MIRAEYENRTHDYSLGSYRFTTKLILQNGDSFLFTGGHLDMQFLSNWSISSPMLQNITSRSQLLHSVTWPHCPSCKSNEHYVFINKSIIVNKNS